MDDGLDKSDPLIPLNTVKNQEPQTAVAIQRPNSAGALPIISAAGRGALADQILQLAFDNGVRVREDPALAEMLARIDIDSPVPSQALLAVAEILSYVYRANGEDDPFNAILDETQAPAMMDAVLQENGNDQEGEHTHE